MALIRSSSGATLALYSRTGRSSRRGRHSAIRSLIKGQRVCASHDTTRSNGSTSI
jgi:hypothetical protein